MATSVIDYIFRVLGMEYMGRTDFVQVKPTKDEDVKMQLESSAALERSEEAKEQQKRKEAAETPPPVAVVKGAAAQSTADGLQTAEAGVVVNLADAKRSSQGVTGQLTGMMGDAPFCDQCGHVTVRNGACYKCINCGNSMGCS